MELPVDFDREKAAGRGVQGGDGESYQLTSTERRRQGGGYREGMGRASEL